jgi:hypothetical protein
LINPTRLPEAEQLGWKRALLGARGTLFCLLGSIGCIKHPSLLANPRAPKSGPGGPIFAQGLISISNPGRFQRRAASGLLRKKGDGGAQRERTAASATVISKVRDFFLYSPECGAAREPIYHAGCCVRLRVAEAAAAPPPSSRRKGGGPGEEARDHFGEAGAKLAKSEK